MTREEMVEELKSLYNRRQFASVPQRYLISRRIAVLSKALGNIRTKDEM